MKATLLCILKSHLFALINDSSVALLVVTRPVSRDGGMAEDHRVQKPGNS